tara:strand:- start:102 stop:521 length:420 start_codon:yes stop_codon:yes gene_type:complete
MLSKKILVSLSIIALLGGAPAVVSAGEADLLLKKGQVYKTGKGAAAGQTKAAGSGGGGAGAGAAGAAGGVAAGTVVAGVAVAAAIGVAVAAVTDDASTTTTTTTTATCLECSGFGPARADGGPQGPGTTNFRREGNAPR